MIFESFTEFLNETYSSSKELVNLTKDILKKVTTETKKENINNNIKGWILDLISDRIYSIDNISMFQNSKFKELDNFIKKSNLKIFFMNDDFWKQHKKLSGNDDTIAFYENSSIYLRTPNDDHIDSFLTGKKSLLNYEYDTDLLHELQHAFDDFRSKNLYNTQKDLNIKELEKVLKNQEKKFKIKDIEYLNLRYEVDARFAEALSLTIFADDNYINPNFDSALSDFKLFFDLDVLIPSERKRILNLFGKFYIMKKEELQN